MSDVLHLKHRPGKLSEVVGQDAAIEGLQSVIKHKSSQAFLLGGPSGVGKTTIARLGAKLMGGSAAVTIVEMDAATRTGVDDVRALQDMIDYRPLGGGHRALIVDECQRLSKQAWDALLKVIEEPPDHLSWWFCTTEPGKVPLTIKTRCTTFQLREVERKDLDILLDRVCVAEKIDIDDAVYSQIITEAKGSPRQLLVNLAICRDIKDLKQAKAALAAAVESDAIIDLCRFMTAGQGSWAKAMGIMERLNGENPESVRIVMCNYLASALKGTSSNDKAGNLLEILDNFSVPYNTSEGFAPLYLSIGRSLFR